MKRIFILLVLYSCPLILSAQLVINELMAGNTKTYRDNNGDFDDWIEIYNPGDIEVNLGEYYITDNFNRKLKYKLSADYSIQSNEYLVIFADDESEQGGLHTNFKLALEGEEIGLFKLSGADTLLIDTLTFSLQKNDISYGRYPAGGNNFEFFLNPTPGSANVSDNLKGIAPKPEFSVPGGFYSGLQSVEISTGLAGAQIRYTTDGSEPDESSKLYNSAITSDTTIIIKAKVYAGEYVPGEIQANTYFIDEHFVAFNEEDRLPVVSISCDPDLLYDPTQGILIRYSENIEVPASFELFEPDGSTSINQGVGIRVFGNVSRYFDQKSLVAYARIKYGKGSFDYKFFNDKPFDKYESIVFRNGGSDWSLSYIRDGLCQALIRNNMEVDAQGGKHAIMYLNGEFYGIIELKEKINENYIAQNCGVDPDNIEILNQENTAIIGDNKNYNEFSRFMAHIDLSVPSIYQKVGKMMDITNFMNMQIAETFISNIDVYNNLKFWRENEKYGRWSWIIFDTEIGYGQEGDYSYTNLYGTSPSSNSMILMTTNQGTNDWPYYRPWSSEKMMALLKNEVFRNEYIQSFAVHINTTFKSSRALHFIDSMQLRISREIPYQIAKYGGQTVDYNPWGIHFSTVEAWEDHVEVLRDFARQRPDYMRSFIADRFGLKGLYNLVPTVNDKSKGTISIQDIFVPLDSSGIYFDSIPIRIKAIPKDGFRFSHWEGITGIDSLSPELQLRITEDDTIHAVFVEESNLLISEILYLNTSGYSEFIEIKNPKQTISVDISKYEISGDINFVFPDSVILNPGEYLVVAADRNLVHADSSHIFQWSSGSLNDSAGVIVLKDSFGITVDSLKYSSTLSWPDIDSNYSIELLNDNLDNLLGSSWSSCMFKGGLAGVPDIDSSVYSLRINEFMADNSDFIADNRGNCNDWIEIVNLSDKPVNLGGLYLTNNLDKPTLFQIPMNAADQTTIQPGEYIILWADNEPDEGPLHLGFKLNAANRAIGIGVGDKEYIHSITFGSGATNISTGLYPDGTGDYVNFNNPSPGFKNSYAPEFTSNPELWCQLGEQFEYNITASDGEGEELLIGYYEKPYWCTFTTTGNGTATLTGIMPGGVSKRFPVILYLTDGLTDPVFQEFFINRGINPTSIDYENMRSGSFTCYPNPTDGKIFFEIATKSPVVNLTISNIAGQIVFSEEMYSVDNEISDQIDISDCSEGVYFITIKSVEGTETKKIILY